MGVTCLLGRKFCLAATVLAGLLQGCGPTDAPSDPNAISNRPQQYDRFIAIVRLSEPALLETAQKVQGRIVVDPAQRERILAEQADFEATLAAEFPEVRVIDRYRLVLNGMVIVAPNDLKPAFRDMSQVSYIEAASRLERTPTEDVPDGDGAIPLGLGDDNSTTFIDANRVHSELTAVGPGGERTPVTGKGIRVGIIDTGIDYTHAMFGGSGSVSAYERNDRSVIEPGTFPTAKVKGGIDLVGATYNPASPNFDDHIPQPDEDPLDRQGHGTHVAGTVAGIGDGTNTYSGVAPDAELYAIKVFSDGLAGSTADHVVIAAFEYAVDPNRDLDPEDRLDVVNLSLGSPFGTRHVLYEEALRNMVVGGDVLAACSAGNSGNLEYIVGAPSTVPEALSVAASIDDTVANGARADQLAPFSSRGPRSLDGLFKPEIAAPGYQILSAKVGSGRAGTRKSGTSMAAPHVAGVAALVRQARRDLDAQQVKSLLVNTATQIRDERGTIYPFSQQGAGRIRAFHAATGSIVLSPSTITLGVQELVDRQSLTKSVTIENIGSEALALTFEAQGTPGLSVSVPEAFTIAPGAATTVSLTYTIDPAEIAPARATLDASVRVVSGDEVLASLPALAVVRRHSALAVASVREDGTGTRIRLSNSGGDGEAVLFRRLGTDPAVPTYQDNPTRTAVCDLESAGYRVETRTVGLQTRRILQIAVNLHGPVTSWHLCEISVQIDREGDGRPEQELLGTYLATLSELYDGGDARFQSFLMDWDEMVATRRRIERDYDLDSHQPTDYIRPAMVGYERFIGVPESTLAVVEADLAKVARASDGSFYVKIGVLSGSGTEPEADDFLGDERFLRIDPSAGVLGDDATVQVPAGETVEIRAQAPRSDLILYMPNNAGSDRSQSL